MHIGNEVKTEVHGGSLNHKYLESAVREAVTWRPCVHTDT